MSYDKTEPVELEIDGMLDLHTFRPGEISSLIPEYVKACRNKGITEIRIVHGKGLGILKKSVQAVLERTDGVEWFGPAPHDRGHWGATIVKLAK